MSIANVIQCPKCGFFFDKNIHYFCSKCGWVINLMAEEEKIASRKEGKMASRKIEDLVPALQEKYYLFKAEMEKANIPFIVTCTARSILEHIALYVRGRLSLLDVNRFNYLAGMPLLQLDSQNVKVTWTLNSLHVTNMLDKDLNNDLSRAFDIAIIKDGKAVWDIKVNVNQNEIPDYTEAANIGKSVGLECGAFWKNPDYPHFQLRSE
jgi:uncharacterized Zn finger protein (UPF0148 family)